MKSKKLNAPIKRRHQVTRLLRVRKKSTSNKIRCQNKTVDKKLQPKVAKDKIMTSVRYNEFDKTMRSQSDFYGEYISQTQNETVTSVPAINFHNYCSCLTCRRNYLKFYHKQQNIQRSRITNKAMKVVQKQVKNQNTQTIRSFATQNKNFAPTRKQSSLLNARNIWFPHPSKLLITENAKVIAHNRIYNKSEKFVKHFDLPIQVYKNNYYTKTNLQQTFNFSEEYNHSYNQYFPIYENNLTDLVPTRTFMDLTAH